MSAAAASDQESISNGLRSRSNAISGKGGSSSCTTTHTSPATITELGAEHDNPFARNISNCKFNHSELNNTNNRCLGKGECGENSDRWIESESAGERVDSGEGDGGVGGCAAVGRKEVAAEENEEEEEVFEFQASEAEFRIPWKWLRKERSVRVIRTRTRFPEPCVQEAAAPEQVGFEVNNNWSFKMARPTTPITAFFKNRSVFVTGATGFLGKATVEKLLRTCPDVQTVYILIRPKSGSDVQARLEELLDNSVSSHFTLKKLVILLSICKDPQEVL